jgi:hypothetical protein
MHKSGNKLLIYGQFDAAYGTTEEEVTEEVPYPIYLEEQEVKMEIVSDYDVDAIWQCNIFYSENQQANLLGSVDEEDLNTGLAADESRIIVTQHRPIFFFVDSAISGITIRVTRKIHNLLKTNQPITMHYAMSSLAGGFTSGSAEITYQTVANIACLRR